MTSIGSAETARALYSAFNGEPYTRSGYYKKTPKGFRRIGAGCYRTAYLETATNVVYKMGNSSQNLMEWGNARMLRRKSSKSLGFKLVIPRTRAYVMPRRKFMDWQGRPYFRDADYVIAQEFAGKVRKTYCAAQDTWMSDVPACNCKKPAGICFEQVHERIIDFTGLTDIHGENVLMNKETREFWLIDLAF